MKLAKLADIKRLEQFDFKFQPSADERRINELKTLGFVERSENVIFLGPPGVGKSHLVVGLAVEAQKRLYCLFLSAHELIAMIKKISSPARFTAKSKPSASLLS